MSQTAFLEDVIGWSEEKCQQNLDETLPRLISTLGDVNTLEETVGILKIICQTFLPLVKQHEAEDRVFSKISRLACTKFDEIFENISELPAVNENVPLISSFLEMVFDILDCIDNCIKSVNSYENLHICHIHSLSSCTIHLLKGTYTHCKGSADLYQDLLSTLSESLSMLFRKAHTVQMAFLNMFDKVIILYNGEETKDLCEVCEGLFEVCQIVTSLDVKVVVSIWKAVSRITSRYKDILSNKLTVHRMIIYLCQEICAGYEYLFQLAPRVDATGKIISAGDEKSFKKSMKILAFYMKILVMFITDYRDLLGDSVNDIFNLLLCVLKMLPPSLSRPKISEVYMTEIKLNIGDAVEPFVENLILDHSFIKCFMETENDASKDLRLPRLLLLIKFLDMLPNFSDEEVKCWFPPSSEKDNCNCDDIMTVIFRSFGQCFVELAFPVFLPALTSNGNQQRDVSLYEYVYTRLCRYIMNFPARYFSVLEKCLFQHAFSNNPFVYLLAVDCWCFVIRCSNTDLCNKHIMLLCHLHKTVHCTSLQSFRSSQIGNVIHRLAKFLSPEHQQNLPKMFVPRDNLALWTDLPVSSMCDAVFPHLAEELFTCCTKILNNWTKLSTVRQKDIPSVIVSLRCLNSLFMNSSFVKQHIVPKQQQQLVGTVCGIWKGLYCNNWNLSPLLSFMLSSLFSLSSHLIMLFQTPDLLQILSLTQKVLSQQPPVFVRLSSAKFLQNCGLLQIPPNIQQLQILNKISCMFRTLLLDSNCFVHHETLSAFSKFAEATVHESVVPECIGNNSHLQKAVISFLNKVSYQPSEYLIDKEKYLSSQINEMCYSQNQRETVTTEKTSEPERKRLKLEFCQIKDNDYKKVLEDLQSVCTRLKQLSSAREPPEGFLQSCGSILEQMLQTAKK